MTLADIAHARSGDKGNLVNIGVFSYKHKGYEFLRKELSSDRVMAYFADICGGDVTRYELPQIGALNFVLDKALGHGTPSALRSDSQGKVLGVSILQMQLIKPEFYKEMLRDWVIS